MSPEETKRLAEQLAKVPGFKGGGIDLKDVRRLVELLRESPEVGSIEVKGMFGTGVVVTRTPHGGAAWASPLMPEGAGAGHANPGAAQVHAPVAAPPPRPAATLKEIKSPMVGTFYAAPEPGAEPYVRVGQRISAGQTVCIVEAMKIMNEIEAEVSGVIREISVEDAQPVEFGQVLFRVDPNG
ncbi:MAG TPA: acetyl-CoA carboxylase biotin carboxyl carrier protein [Gemmatimonadales bacterium]